MVYQFASPIRAVVVDDHASFSRGLQLLFGSVADSPVEVMAITEHAAEAVHLVREHRADVALVDIQMPPPGGLAAIAELRRHVPDCAVIVLSGVEDPEVVVAALRAGAEGYLLKSAEPEHLIPPIRSVLSGMVVVPDWMRTHIGGEPATTGPALPALSDEDVMVLRLLAAGADTASVARQILVSERTAKRTVANLVRRLGVGTRIEAVVLATHAGLIELPGPRPH